MTALRDGELAIYFEGSDRPRILEFTKQPEGGWVVGRSTGSHIEFRDLTVSRTHAVIQAQKVGSEVFWKLQHLGRNATRYEGQPLVKNQWVPFDKGSYCFGESCVYVALDWHATVECERELPETQDLVGIEAAIANLTPDKIEGWSDFAAAATSLVIAIAQRIWRGPIQHPSSLFRVIWQGVLLASLAYLMVRLVPVVVALL